MSQPDYSGGLSLADARKIIGDRPIQRMSSNENPLGTSPHTVAAMTRAAQSISLYPPRTDAELREHLADYHNISSDHIYCGMGGCEVIEIAFRAFTQAGDNFIVCTPTFGFYYFVARELELEVREAALQADTFALDVDAILAQIDDHTRFVVIINPNNPTGTMFPESALNTLLDALPDHVTLLADEVYFHFVTDPAYPDTVDKIRNGANIVRVHSFSKAYGMGGMRVGYGITSKQIAARLNASKRPFHLNNIALQGAQAALGDEDFVQTSIENNSAGLAYLAAALTRLQIRYWPTQANFVMLETPFSSGDMTDKLLQQGIMVRDPKDSNIPNCIRVTIGTPEQNQAFIAALEAVL